MKFIFLILLVSITEFSNAKELKKKPICKIEFKDDKYIPIKGDVVLKGAYGNETLEKAVEIRDKAIDKGECELQNKLKPCDIFPLVKIEVDINSGLTYRSNKNEDFKNEIYNIKVGDNIFGQLRSDYSPYFIPEVTDFINNLVDKNICAAPVSSSHICEIKEFFDPLDYKLLDEYKSKIFRIYRDGEIFVADSFHGHNDYYLKSRVEDHLRLFVTAGFCNLK